MELELVNKRSCIAVTLLHGFLGAGKTTVLRNWLTNAEGVRVGVVVNDVAEVNIDGDLISNMSGAGAHTLVQLENGCACCSLGDDLLSSLEHLVKTGLESGKPYDHIIVECSGVAEPSNTKQKLWAAQEAEYEVMDKCELRAMVTVVDASTFLEDFQCADTLRQREDLGEWQSGDLAIWGGNRRRVVDLLTAQVEVADVLVLNKVDTVPTQVLPHMQELLRTLNPTARTLICTWGAVSLAEAVQDGIASSALWAQAPPLSVRGLQRSAAHHTTEAALETYRTRSALHAPPPPPHTPVCSAAAGGHTAPCNPAPQNPAPGPHRAQCQATACSGRGCHVHPAPEAASSAGTSHALSGLATGICHFVYTARRPFHLQRLQAVLAYLPVATQPGATGPPAALELEALNQAAGAKVGPKLNCGPPDHPLDSHASRLAAVLRSKGFVWLASPALHSQRCYWSHAGSHFELSLAGDWWAAAAPEEWAALPVEARTRVARSFCALSGDRRQELVFIGHVTQMDQQGICSALDTALVSSVELEEYNAQLRGYSDVIQAADVRTMATCFTSSPTSQDCNHRHGEVNQYAAGMNRSRSGDEAAPMALPEKESSAIADPRMEGRGNKKRQGGPIEDEEGRRPPDVCPATAADPEHKPVVVSRFWRSNKK
mmetsp:Transcript_16591/g.36099  ORF Transcript_16591/g.36099 Transcript_16591/m.36099 type:complete len:657 (-) Transcript_16591:102-2072(-)|eukprot:CAMPEP_0118924292 /NCGR_PEP_ID=MMETSP1169-20130426/2491_1 /TAXON_ID=36882 /ORGANISM="Pyramimonas obovata, Strain CCMP722" /LENGTH=656 /DNA_ID=CAMNT_0006865389 /DNA_START=264 /DNA_END=2234 /DNA_ORIENTATION=+